MKLIICTDIDNGMMFNNRRLSKDRLLIKHIYNIVNDKKLWINGFSKELFKYAENYNVNVIINEEFENIPKDDFCFIENISPKILEEKIEEIILYNWNRKYPADMYFDILLDDWILESEMDIKGSSHDKITQRIYRKGGE